MLCLFLILIICLADRASLRRRLSNHEGFDAPCAEALMGHDFIDLILQHTLIEPGPGAKEQCKSGGLQLCDQLGANLQDTSITCVPNDGTEGFAYIGKSELEEGDSFFCAQYIYDVNPDEVDTVQRIVTLADSDATVHFSKNAHDIQVAECVERDAIWNLNYLDRSSPNAFQYDSGDGLDVTVYVIDTGVNEHHDFGDRLLGGWNLIETEEDNDLTDHNGHGTHVAGIIAGTAYGVAKEANIWAVKIVNEDGYTQTSYVLAAIQKSVERALDNHEKAVINLSLGGGIDSALDHAVNEANEIGIPVTVSSGNDGVDACLSSPARAEGGICVASHDANGRWSAFSNKGACVDIIAPGTGILSTSYTRSDGETRSGSSMAAPHVAGVIAQIMSRTQITDTDTIKEMLYTGDYGADEVIADVPDGTTNRVLQSPCIDREPEVDCDSCVAQFTEQGGCECWSDDSCDESALIPSGCDPCGNAAAEACGMTGITAINPKANRRKP